MNDNRYLSDNKYRKQTHSIAIKLYVEDDEKKNFLFKILYLSSDPDDFEKECVIVDNILNMYKEYCPYSYKTGTGIVKTCLSSKFIYKPTTSKNDEYEKRAIKNILIRGGFLHHRYGFSSKEIEVKDYYKRIIEMYYYYCYGSLGQDKILDRFKEKYYLQLKFLNKVNSELELKIKLKKNINNLKKNIKNLLVKNNINSINNINNIKKLSIMNESKLKKLRNLQKIEYNKLKEIKKILSEYKEINNNNNTTKNSFLYEHKNIIEKIKENNNQSQNIRVI